jgi:hypothetical protein
MKLLHAKVLHLNVLSQQTLSYQDILWQSPSLYGYVPSQKTYFTLHLRYFVVQQVKHEREAKKQKNRTSLDEEVLLGHLGVQRRLGVRIEHQILRMTKIYQVHPNS